MIVLSLPPAFFQMFRFGMAALAGYLPAHLLLTYWRWPGVFFLAGLLFLPSPVAIAIHMLNLSPQKINFFWQCGFVGCSAASFFFVIKRQGWMKM